MAKDMRDVSGLVTYIDQIVQERSGARVAVAFRCTMCNFSYIRSVLSLLVTPFIFP